MTSSTTTVALTTTTIFNLCNSGPCVNGGTCAFYTQFNIYTCICPPNYSGNRCETLVTSSNTLSTTTSTTGAVTNSNPCLSNPCINGGTCLSSQFNNYYICNCPAGYTGTICSLIVIKTFLLDFKIQPISLV